MQSKQRIVLDTNLWISYLIKADSPVGRIVSRILRHHWVLVSEATLLELADKVDSERLRLYFSAAEGLRLVLLLKQVAEWVSVQTVVRDCRDPKDDKFLALVLDGKADVLITGDRDLLALHPYRDIPIVQPRDYENRYEG